MTEVFSERDDGEPIEVREAHVAERCRDPPRHVELRGLHHGSTDVDPQVDGKVALLVEQPEQQAIETLICLPVDVTVVVPRGVGPMIGELEAATAFRREPVRTVLPRQRALGDNVQVLELAEKIVLKAEGHAQYHRRSLSRCILCLRDKQEKGERRITLVSKNLVPPFKWLSLIVISIPSQRWQRAHSRSHRC